MTDLTARHIELVREGLRSRLDELLACDELWHGKLTRAVVEAAGEEKSGLRCVVTDTSYFPPEQIERAHFFMLRDLLVAGLAADLMLAWAKTP